MPRSRPQGLLPARREILDVSPGSELVLFARVLIDERAARRLQRRVVLDREALDLRVLAVARIAPAAQPRPLACFLAEIARQALIAVLTVELEPADLDVLAPRPEPPDLLELLADVVDDQVMVPPPLAEGVLGVKNHHHVAPAVRPAPGGEICAEALEPVDGSGAPAGKVLLVIGQRDHQIAGPEVGRQHQLQLLIAVLPVHPLLGGGA